MTTSRHNSKNFLTNRRTPDIILNKVYDLYGEIDLDPASDEEANKRVKAKKIYTKEDNGFSENLSWDGKVFLNYPGGKIEGLSYSVPWLIKAKAEINYNSQCTDIIVVLFSVEHLNLNQFLFDEEVILCYLRKRLFFVNPETNEEEKSPPHHNAILYFSKFESNILRFKDIFSDLGAVVKINKI